VPPHDALDRTWLAVADNVAIARHTVVRHLNEAATSDPPLSDVALAVSEAVTNVVHHAYVGRKPGPVRVRVDIGSHEIELLIEDHGSGMVPRPDTPGLGLGLPVIATISERLDVRDRSDGGTRVSMWFSRDPEDATLES
jgi:serine/threonine-protein kinase RsbW